MKRIVCIILAVLFVLPFAGCKKKDDGNSSSQYDVDIAYYLSVGQFKEAKFGLGTDPQLIENEAVAEGENVAEGNTGDDHDEANQIRFQEGVVSCHYISGPFYYYYNKGKENDGISLIVNFDTAYGFQVGTSTDFEIKNAVSSMNPVMTDATDDDLFFMFMSTEGYEKLTCTSGKYELNFFFKDGILVCSAIENTTLWSVDG